MLKKLKVYTDATVINNKSGIGYIIKDKHNNIINISKSVINEKGITQAEVKSIIEALKTAKELCDSIVVYTDNHSVVEMFEHEAEPNKDDMQGLMWYLRKISDDIDLTLQHINSEDNPADLIAKKAAHPFVE